MAAALASAAKEMPSLRNEDKLGDLGEVAFSVLLLSGAGAGGLPLASLEDSAAGDLHFVWDVVGLLDNSGAGAADEGEMAGGTSDFLLVSVSEGLSTAASGLEGSLISFASAASFLIFSSSNFFSFPSFSSICNSFCKVSTGLASPNGFGFGALGTLGGGAASTGAAEASSSVRRLRAS